MYQAPGINPAGMELQRGGHAKQAQYGDSTVLSMWLKQ